MSLKEHIIKLREILNKTTNKEDLVILWDFGMELKIVATHKIKVELDKIKENKK